MIVLILDYMMPNDKKWTSVNLTKERWNGLTYYCEKRKPSPSKTAMVDFLLDKAGVKLLTDKELSELLSKLEMEVMNN